jgi:flagellar hook-associated protein 1 FlgK
MANILSIGQTALNAAQLGLATTSHNIANASTPGYSRQLVIQTTPIAQNVGVAFAGNGTAIAEITRSYNNFLTGQVNSAQTSQGELSTFYSQIQQINNMFADPTSGLSPTIQDFFTSIQNVAANPSSGASRQTMLASANSLASRFQSLDGQVNEIRDGVNEQITTTIGSINTAAAQIASLNDAISKAQLGNDLKPANDLLDQRDQVISDLSKLVQVSIVKQGDNYNIFIGNGQPLVTNNQSYALAAVPSATDLNRMEVGITQPNGVVIPLSENNITGGALGGLFDFRSQTLDPAQNALGRIAIGIASTFNAQHALGQDQNGALGGTFFNIGSPVVLPNTSNTGTSVATATITDPSKLTTSDYSVKYDGTNYIVTQLSDNTILSSTTLAAAQVATAAKGFDLNFSTTPAANDSFLIKPTVAGAAGINVAITDTAKIAVAAPILTGSKITNSGNATISAGSINAPITITSGGGNTGTGQIAAIAQSTPYMASTFTPAVTLTYTAGAPNTLTGFPPTLPVTVTSGGISTTYAAGTPVTYTAGSTVSFGGASFTVSGAPANGDTFTVGINPISPAPAATFTYNTSTTPATLNVSPNTLPVTVTNNGVATSYAAGVPVTYTDGATITIGGASFVISGVPANGDVFTLNSNPNGAGDNRNALLLGALQNTKTLVGGTASYQAAYGQMVNSIGNKTRELEVTSTAATQLVTSAVQSQQSVSGVNLDEEASNLMRYQQAYQAAGKVMQTASKMFDVLLSLGN